MDQFMTWMTERFAPRMNRLARNAYVAALQDAILTTMPLIFIGTFATIMDVVRELVPSWPDFSAFNTYTFGLLSLFLAFLIPYSLMEKKKQKQTRRQAGWPVSRFL